jgi:hypothetical protein
MKRILQFKNYQYLQSPVDGIEFMFSYQLKDDTTSTVEDYRIKVSISGSLAAGWGFQIWSPQPDKEYVGIRRLLLYIAKVKIIEKVKEDTLKKIEELVLLTSNSPVDRPIDPENISNIIGQEIIIDIP